MKSVIIVWQKGLNHKMVKSALDRFTVLSKTFI